LVYSLAGDNKHDFAIVTQDANVHGTGM